MYYVLMSFPSYLFVYEIFFIYFLYFPIFWVCTMELGELKLLRHLSLDFSVILRHNTNCDTPKKGKKKKNNPLNDKLSTPYLISNKSIALLREGVSRFFNIINLIPYSTMKANIY